MNMKLNGAARMSNNANACRTSRAIYSTTDEDTARSLLQHYNVAYIFVGDRERKQYPAAGLAKFERMFPIAFQQGTVTLYRVE